MVTQLAEKLNIGLTEDARLSVIRLLSRILADQHLLYIKTRSFHWNLKGPRFEILHEFFEDQYNELEEVIDDTAERIRILGGVAPGTMADFLETGTLKEQPAALTDGSSALAALEADHEACARELREAIVEADQQHGDLGTADFLTELLRRHEKTAWMIRSHLTA